VWFHTSSDLINFSERKGLRFNLGTSHGDFAMSVIHSGTVEGPAEEADQPLGFAERNLLIWQAISKV
jgi:hypothetical protein